MYLRMSFFCCNFAAQNVTSGIGSVKSGENIDRQRKALRKSSIVNPKNIKDIEYEAFIN